jgi:regulator of replication initiation timing
MMTMQKSQTTNDPYEEKVRQLAGDQTPATDERARLQVLVGELLSENQKLRFENQGLRIETANLKGELEKSDRGLANATKWAAMVL